jgi:hypothetical protein
MEITLSHDFEQNAIDHLRYLQRDEKVPAPWIVSAPVQFLRWGVGLIVSLVVVIVERKNDKLQRHVDWLRAETPQLRERVLKTGAVVSERLLQPLDDLRASLEADAARLTAIADDVRTVSEGTELERAMRRSVRIFLAARDQLGAFRAAGLGLDGQAIAAEEPAAADPEFDRMLANGRATSLRLAAHLKSGTVECEPELLALAAASVQNRNPAAIQDPKWARNLVAGS